MLCLFGWVSVFAQSNLPACQGSDVSRWNNCVGTDTFVNGTKYVGEWKNGNRNGQGTTTTDKGDSYVGEWKDDKPNVQGTMIFSIGGSYVGEWKDGKYNGQGTDGVYLVSNQDPNPVVLSSFVGVLCSTLSYSLETKSSLFELEP